MEKDSRVALLLGANLKNRTRTFALARAFISQRIGSIVKSSPLYFSEPWGVDYPQPAYINQVIVIQTKLFPRGLLKEIKRIERQLGRPKKYIRYSPRTLDIDILVYDLRQIKHEDLRIPHQHLFERKFAYIPLSKVWPGFASQLLKQKSNKLPI